MASSAKHTKKHRKRKKGKKRAQQTIDLTLRLNVELAQGKQPRKERVKRITSRKRQNLREMRRSLPGAGGPQAFSNPAFYGNVKMLTDSAMNQFQNKRYAIENQLRESVAEQKALQLADRQEAAQRQGNETQALQAQLADTIRMFTSVTAQQSGQLGHERGVAQQQTQSSVEAAEREERLSEIRQLGPDYLKQQAAEIVAERHPGFKVADVSSGKLRQAEAAILQAAAFGRGKDKEAVLQIFDNSKAVQRLKREAQAAETESPLRRTAALLERRPQPGDTRDTFATPTATPGSPEPEPELEP